MFCKSKKEEKKDEKKDEKIVVSKERLKDFYALFFYFKRIYTFANLFKERGLKIDFYDEIDEKIESCVDFLNSLFHEELVNSPLMVRTNRSGYNFLLTLNDAIFYGSLPYLERFVNDTLIKNDKIEELFCIFIANGLLDFEKFFELFPEKKEDYKKLIFPIIDSPKFIDFFKLSEIEKTAQKIRKLFTVSEKKG